ncbi:hypothetical protein [Streptomyces sp. NPDC057302]|uniref:hypothetical protein n=1 Tax=Streptomyces sp. NPDC057302 TaxID=3346094 RepID=UPI003632B648
MQFGTASPYELLWLAQSGVQEPHATAERLKADALPQCGDLLLHLTAICLGDLPTVFGVLTHGRIDRDRAAAPGQTADRFGRQSRAQSEAPPRLVEADAVEEQQIADRMSDRFLERSAIAVASGSAQDSGSNDLEIAGLGVRRLPSVVAGVVTQPPQDEVPDLGTRSRSVAVPVLFVAPLLVARLPVGDRDVPGFQRVLKVVGHRRVSVTVVEVKTGGVARELGDRPFGPR